MSGHDLMLVALCARAVVIAATSWQVAAEFRWRRWCARRDRLAEAVAERP